MSKKYRPIVTRSMLEKLCESTLATKSLTDACETIREFASTIKKRSNWYRDLMRLANELPTLEPFTIFAKGNSKLPFYAFSALPRYTCPGAGACLDWCYSFRAWRYPGGFARQLQNTLLLRFRPRSIIDAWRKIPVGSTVRLYVDGDFDSIQTVAFWFRLLRSRPDVQAYGYSKSLHLLVEWDSQGLPFPANYRLNLSEGSIHDGSSLWAIASGLPITRGVFGAVEVSGHGRGNARYDSPAYHAEVRAAGKDRGFDRPFSCPGKCGECLPRGEHACGSDRMAGVPILIGIH